MSKRVNIPASDCGSVLRNVRLPEGHRLLTWDANRRYGTGQHMVGYAFYLPGESTPLFTGCDCGVAPSDAIDSDRALAGVIGWLALKPGDMSREYFEHYTAAQLEWCASGACDDLGMISYDSDNEESYYVWREDLDGIERLCVRSTAITPFVFTDIEGG